MQLGRASIAGVAAVLLLVACGQADDKVEVSHNAEAEDVKELVFDAAEMADRHPAFASTSAGRVVLFDHLVAAPETADDFVAPTELFVVDSSEGTVTAVGLPDGFALQAGVATPSGFIVLGGPCADRRVPQELAEQQPVCPELVTTSYRLEWETGEWTALTIPESLVQRAAAQEGFYPYIPDGYLLQHQDSAAVLMRTSLEITELLLLDDTGWRSAGEFPADMTSPCSAGHAVSWLERDLSGEKVDRQQLVEVDETGTVQRHDLPDSVSIDAYGGASVSTGCDGESSVLVYGDSAPTSSNGVRAFRLTGRTWDELTVPEEIDRAGSLATIDASSTGGSAVTFTRLADENAGLVRTTYLLPTGDESFVEVPDGLDQGGRSEEDLTPLNLYFDPTDHAVISISTSSAEKIVIRWTELP